MNHNAAKAVLQSFYVAGRTKHPPFEDPAHALRILNDYRDLLRHAAEQTHGAGRDAQLQRRLGQIGGICLKALVDVTPDFPEPDSYQCPEPSKSKN